MRRWSLAALMMQPALVLAFDHCPVFYQQDFAGPEARYVTDFPNGYTARVRWGAGGYGGVILRPRDGDRERIPVFRFETFYHSLMCQVESMGQIFSDFTRNFSDRKRCTPLYYADGVGGFQCGSLVASFSLDQNVLGEFLRYESRATSSWYQSADYLEMKRELERLAGAARQDLHDNIVQAAATPPCVDLSPELIELPEESRLFPDDDEDGVTGSITFTVAADGTVSQVLLRRTAGYGAEYLMASAARDHVFPPRQEACRATWHHSFE